MRPEHVVEHELAETQVTVPTAGVTLEGNLTLPDGARGVVLFAHGSGSSRFSPRNRFVAAALSAPEREASGGRKGDMPAFGAPDAHEEGGLGTLLVDLLTPEEERVDDETREYRFDLPRLADRLTGLVDWLKSQPDTRDLPVGLFGSSTGGGAALMTAADRPGDVRAVVSRGGRPDLAGDKLPRVIAPTLLLVGERDEQVIELNEDAAARMRNADVKLDIVPGATHLFEEPGTLEEVAARARAWFLAHGTP